MDPGFLISLAGVPRFLPFLEVISVGGCPDRQTFCKWQHLLTEPENLCGPDSDFAYSEIQGLVLTPGPRAPAWGLLLGFMSFCVLLNAM